MNGNNGWFKVQDWEVQWDKLHFLRDSNEGFVLPKEIIFVTRSNCQETGVNVYEKRESPWSNEYIFDSTTMNLVNALTRMYE